MTLGICSPHFRVRGLADRAAHAGAQADRRRCEYLGLDFVADAHVKPVLREAFLRVGANLHTTAGHEFLAALGMSRGVCSSC